MEEIDRSHLQSARDVNGYRIHATDGVVGHIDDYLVDSRSWAIRYLVVDTRNWLPGRKVLLSPAWAQSVDWAAREVRVAMDREAVKNSPPHAPGNLITREYETSLHEHYRRKPYW
jgi:hypothetical protein